MRLKGTRTATSMWRLRDKFDACVYGDLYNYIITEVPLNCWSSADKVRRYKKLPKKYQKMVNEWERRMEDEE